MKLPQLSLRDLFWLLLVCALAVGWCVERGRVRQSEARNQRLQALSLEYAEAMLRVRENELAGAKASGAPENELRRLQSMTKATRLDVDLLAR